MKQEQASIAESAFIKSMIKIANPTWIPEQIQAEYERKFVNIKENPDDCEMCSG